MTDDEDEDLDVSEGFADPAACGLASALLLLFSVLLATAAGGGTTQPVAAVDLTFELAHAPAGPFEVRFSLACEELCVVNGGTATAGRAFEAAAPCRLFEGQAAYFHRTAGKAELVFTTDPLGTGGHGDRTQWGAGVLVRFAGRPSALELICTFRGDFVVKSVVVRGQLQGAGGDPPEPKKFIPTAGRSFRVVASGREVVVSE